MEPDTSSPLDAPADRWLALAVALLSFAWLWPTLGRFRLLDADELTHARAALEAARDGHWLPLTVGGRVWLEKPPLLPWATALLIRFFGPGEAVLRFWPLAFGAASLGLAYGVARRLGASRSAALAGAALLGTSRDLLYHARFLSMDTGLLAAFLAALLAWDPRRPWRSGLLLGLAAALKSWFVLALLPAFGLALLAAAPWERRAGLRLLGFPAAALLLWLAAYTAVAGPAFLAEEWSVNLWGRFSGAGHPASAPPVDFYTGWARLFFPAALVCAPLALGQAWRDRRSWKAWTFLRRAAVAFLVSWGLGLLAVRVTVYHYLLPWGVVAVLLAAAGVEGLPGAAWALWAVLGAAVFWMAPRLGLAHGWVWAAAALSGLLGLWPESPRRRAWKGAVLAGASVLALSLGGGWAYWRFPPDPHGPLVQALRSRPAPSPGAELWVQGPATQAIDYYSNWKPLFSAEAPPPGRPALRYNGQSAEFFQ